MKIGDLENYLRETDLIKYAYLNIGSVDTSDRSISVVGNNGRYDIYLCYEQGNVHLFKQGLSEEEMCKAVIEKFQAAKRFYERMLEKGLIQEEYKLK